MLAMPPAGRLADSDVGALEHWVALGAPSGSEALPEESNGQAHWSFVIAGALGLPADYGYYAVENKARFHDLQATNLRLLGLDHKWSRYCYGVREFRLGDVHGELVLGILAQ